MSSNLSEATRSFTYYLGELLEFYAYYHSAGGRTGRGGPREGTINPIFYLPEDNKDTMTINYRVCALTGKDRDEAPTLVVQTTNCRMLVQDPEAIESVERCSTSHMCGGGKKRIAEIRLPYTGTETDARIVVAWLAKVVKGQAFLMDVVDEDQTIASKRREAKHIHDRERKMVMVRGQVIEAVKHALNTGLEMDDISTAVNEALCATVLDK